MPKHHSHVTLTIPVTELFKTSGGRLRMLRQLREYTLATLGDIVGYSSAMVQYWETHTVEPSEEQRRALAEALSTSPEWLLLGDESSAEEPSSVALLRTLVELIDMEDPEHVQALSLLGFRLKRRRG